MKILLDESLPTKLRYDFGTDHEVLTVRDMKWLSKKNGELLVLMVQNKFEVFITGDRNLTYQQNFDVLPIIIIVLSGVDNRLDTFRNLVPKLLDTLAQPNLLKVIQIS